MTGKAEGDLPVKPVEAGVAAFLPDPAVDRLTATVLKLAAEVWVLTERVAAFEALAARRGAVPADELAAFQFSPDEDTKLHEARAAFVRAVLGPLSDPGG